MKKLVPLFLFLIIGCKKPSDISNYDKIGLIYEYELNKLTQSIKNRYLINPVKGAPFNYYAEKVNKNFKEIYSLLKSDDSDSRDSIINIILKTEHSIGFLKDSSIQIRLDLIKNQMENKDYESKESLILFQELNVKLLQTLNTRIDQNDFKFNYVRALVVPEKSIIKIGETYHGNIFMAAYDSMRYPKVKFMNEEVPVEFGVGKVAIKGSSKGIKKYNGEIELVKEDTRQPIKLPFEVEIEVK